MENELVPTRQSIAANMYALRAGLSVVSGEVNKGKNTLDKADAHLESVKADAQEAIDGANMVLDHWNEAKARIKRHYKMPVVKALIFTILILVFIGVFAFVLFVWFAPSLFGLNSAEGAGIAVTFGALSIAGIVIFSKQLHYAIEDRRDFKSTYSQDVEPVLDLDELNEYELTAYIDSHSDNNDSTKSKNRKLKLEHKPGVKKSEVDPLYIDSKIAEAEALLSHIQNQENKRIAEAEAEYEKVIANVKVTYIFPAKTMCSVLASIFARMIDERDWENLDYLIYAIETGRAESVKEALQLLDREKQTDRIIVAIQAASREIAKLLVTGFNALSRQISSGISMLSQQIQANSFHTAQLSARMSQIASAQTLNSALLEKANESSSQLVADVHRIAELENMRYNRGY